MDESNTITVNKPWHKKKLPWFILIFILVLSAGGIVLYTNFNRMLSQALMKNFDCSIVSDVYELKFENLRVDFIQGDIKVFNVVMQPREKPLKYYPYINSSFLLTTDKLILKRVKIIELLKLSILKLERIEINKPEITLTLSGEVPVLFPFKDSTGVNKTGKPDIKKFLESFALDKFELINANFHTTNSFKDREFNVKNLNLALNDLYISQHFGKDSINCKSIDFSIESASGILLQTPIRQFSFKDFKFNIEKFEAQKSIDTVIFHFDNFTTGINALEVQTADSIFQLSVKSFGLSYKERSVKLTGIVFKPNISESAIQKRYPFQHTQFSATIASLQMVNLNFDSLMYKKKLYIEEVVLDSVSAAIFKDKTKPLDLKKFPEYLGQQIGGISFPMQIKKVAVKNSVIVNRERKPDGTYAKVTVNKLNATVSNVTTITTDQPLMITNDALLENTAPFTVRLEFDYNKPQFSIDATIGKFNLTGLNTLLKSYTPAKINSGRIDEIRLTGYAYKTKGSGTLKFLYHDLNIDLQLKEQAKWKSTVGAFAANTVLNSSNPVSADKPPRVVSYDVERDQHKGFINIVLKSLFAGLKETMIPSKENRKAIQEEKKEWKQNQKQTNQKK